MAAGIGWGAVGGAGELRRFGMDDGEIFVRARGGLRRRLRRRGGKRAAARRRVRRTARWCCRSPAARVKPATAGGGAAAPQPARAPSARATKAGLASICGEFGVHQMHHFQVAPHGGAPAHHNADQMHAVAHHRGGEIESAGAGIAGLDAVGARIAADQIVMGGIIGALVGEARQRRNRENIAENHRPDGAPGPPGRWRW